jgi:PAS domain S-box-containing protein
MATQSIIDRSSQEPDGKGPKRDGQSKRTLPDEASPDISLLSAAGIGTQSGTPEPKLGSAEAFYSEIIEGAVDVTTLISPDGTILYASAGISGPTSLGYSPQDVVGRNSLDIIHPDDREGVVVAIANAFAGIPTTVEARVRKKDGSWLWAEMRGRTIVRHDGKPVVAVHSRDVSERKALEQQLKASEEYYKSILHQSADLITVADQSGAIRFSSDSIQRILGFGPEEVVGQQLFSFIHPDDLTLAAERLAEAPEVLTELRLRRKDGTWCDCEGIGRMIGGPHREPLMLFNMRDITERKRTAREMVELATIVNNSNDAIIGFSRDFKITRWNPAAERAFGTPPKRP